MAPFEVGMFVAQLVGGTVWGRCAVIRSCKVDSTLEATIPEC